MSDLHTILEKAVEFDREACETAGIGGRKLFSNHDTYQFGQGARWQHAELKPILDALIECAEEMEFYANTKNWESAHGNGGGTDNTIKGDLLEWTAGGKARQALANLRKACGEGK